MCRKKCVLILLLINSSLLIQGQAGEQFFRRDYTYIHNSKSFYKIQTQETTWENARYKCELEGASLFYPEDEDEASDVISFWNNTQPFLPYLFIGAATWNVEEIFETIDGRPIMDVYNTWGYGEPNNAGGKEGCVILRRDGTLNDDDCNKRKGFICKKTLSSLEWDERCNTPYSDYKYSAKLSRCYKFLQTPKNWSEAYAACHAEESYLAVINSDEEASVLVNIASQATTPNDKENIWKAIHLGFRKRDQSNPMGVHWITRNGVPIEQSGYSTWRDGEPDVNSYKMCGAMFYDGQLTGIDCSQKTYFICELEIRIKSEEIGFRFAI